MDLKDVIQWDVKTWSRALSHWEKNFHLQTGMTALAIGEREGGLSLWLALKDLQVTCTDYNNFPETTYSLHKDYEIEKNITYNDRVDVTDLSRFPDNHFDVVVFKSVLGALSEKEKQTKAFQEMKRVLKPGGAILFAENLKASILHQKLRKRFVKWNNYWRYFDFKNDQDFYTSFSSKQLETVGFLATFGKSESQRSKLASLDKLIHPFLTKRVRYVLMGVLIK